MGQEALHLGWMGLHHHKGRGPWIRGDQPSRAPQLKSWRSSLWRRCRPPVAAPTLMPTCKGLVCEMAHANVPICMFVVCFLLSNVQISKYICFDLVESFLWKTFRCVRACVCVLYFLLFHVPDYTFKEKGINMCLLNRYVVSAYVQLYWQFSCNTYFLLGFK